MKASATRSPPQAARRLRSLFRRWKQHYSLYPATGRLVAALKDDLAPYEVSKGTIRFPLSEAVPVKLIGRIAKFLAQEAARRARPKLAKSKKRR